MGNQPGSGRTNVINQKANRQWQSFEKLKKDVKKANSYACFIKLNTLQFKLLVKNNVSKELLPVVWRFGDNVKVQVIVNGGVPNHSNNNNSNSTNNNNKTNMLNNNNKKKSLTTTNNNEDDGVNTNATTTTTTTTTTSNENDGIHKNIDDLNTDTSLRRKPCDVLVSVATFYKIFVLLLEVVDIPFGLDKKRSSGGGEDEIINNSSNNNIKEEDEDYDKECIICMENDIEIVLQCSHAFCKACYTQWKERNKECPYCRSTVMPDVNSEDIWTIDETDCLEELNKRLIDLEVIIMGFLFTT